MVNMTNITYLYDGFANVYYYDTFDNGTCDYSNYSVTSLNLNLGCMDGTPFIGNPFGIDLYCLGETLLLDAWTGTDCTGIKTSTGAIFIDLTNAGCGYTMCGFYSNVTMEPSMNSTSNLTCNGVLGVTGNDSFVRPSGVCTSMRNGTVYTSSLLDCETESMLYYDTYSCEGNATSWSYVDNMQCDAEDCDYAILTIYDGTVDDGCNFTYYSEYALVLGEVVTDLGTATLLCDNGTVMFDIGFGPPSDATAVLAAFLELECFSIVCTTVDSNYTTGSPTPSPEAPTVSPEPTVSPAPTEAPAVTVGDSSSMLSIGTATVLLAITALVR